MTVWTQSPKVIPHIVFIITIDVVYLERNRLTTPVRYPTLDTLMVLFFKDPYTELRVR